jgi:hypothetical protein
MKDIEHQIASLEEKVASLGSAQLGSQERYSKYITLIFTALSGLVAVVAICITILSFLARTDAGAAKADVDKAVGEMRAEIKGAEIEMQKKFEAMSGEALKKPLLNISDSQGLLDGRTFEISPGIQPPFYPLFFKNIGDKRTEPLSIRLHTSSNLPQISNGNEWQPIATNDKDYPFSFYSNFGAQSRTAAIGIAPQETWTMHPDFPEPLFPAGTNLVVCRLQVFYGADKPAEAKFIIKFK